MTDTKTLFCTVITTFDDTLESPLVLHIRAHTMEIAEKLSIDYLRDECGFDDDMIKDNFDIFTFRVVDIIE